MSGDAHLVAEPWVDYELLDSGDNAKLERYGEIIVARPETQALWAKQRPERWKDIHAEFGFEEKKGAWTLHKPVPEEWGLARGPLRFSARLTSFKHTGIFPEQAPNWDWVRDRVQALEKPQVLNLFGYTGIASVAAAEAGAFVTHVDASKQSLDWAHENARISEIPEDRIRWILDDALAFARREMRRLPAGRQASGKYDGIILDPPAFGRGVRGEVWHIEEDMPKLLDALKALMSDAPGSFFLMNGYAAGYAPLSFAQAVESAFGEVSGESGELRIVEASGGRAVPAGLYVRFVR